MICAENDRNDKLMDNPVYILPGSIEYGKIDDEVLHSSAVAVCLYYEDTVERYLTYLKNIPSAMDIYIITSNERVEERIKQFKENNRNIKMIRKENRGRDISALLVAFRVIALKYKYICFIHDKKPYEEKDKSDVENWIENLWNNTLGSEKYIYNVLSLLESRKELGLLVPPSPFGEHIDAWYGNAWYGNYEITCRLAKELSLRSVLNRDISPVAIGTVFWCRVAAFKKLFERKWKYEDFLEEPLPRDGTISHAIERILPYLVEDAGYVTGTIVIEDYGAYLIKASQLLLKDSFRIMGKYLGIKNMYQLVRYERQRQEIEGLFEKCSRVYLYGAGNVGKEYARLLSARWGSDSGLAGFVVSSGHKTCDFLDGYPVYELETLKLDGKEGFLITAKTDLHQDMIDNLTKHGITNYVCCVEG